MSAIHKISEDFYESSYTLIAIHSSLEDYSIAYLINKQLTSKLNRAPIDLDFSENVSFPFFEWKDTFNDAYWTLIINTSVEKESKKQEGLFSNELTYTTHFLVPEYKEVDYFIKIEQAVEETEDIVKKLLMIPEIITAYSIEVTKLKSKNNLIF